MRMTLEQANRMIVDVRNANPHILVGWAVLPSDNYVSSNELYEEIGRTFEIAMQNLRDKKMISTHKGGYGQNFETYGFPFEIPNMEQLDMVFSYIDLQGSQFRYRCIFRYITNDEVEYTTTLRIAYIPGNDRLEPIKP